MLNTLSKENLHHTNICVGAREDIILEIDGLISKLTPHVTHIERLVYEYDKFLIADARHIFSIHLHKTSQDSMQIICIAFNSTTIESQNSLLKMLEEPRPNTYFFIIVPSKKTILPTVLSRAHLFEFKHATHVSDSTHSFIKANYAIRFETVKKIIDNLKDEKITKQDVIEFVEELESYTHAQGNTKLLKRIIEIKEYLKDPGASVKQLLEYLAVEI